MRVLTVSACISMALSLVLASACDSGSKLPRPKPVTQGSGGGAGFNPGVGGACQDGVCGNEVHTLKFDAPNIYFVLDRSGSMSELAAPSGSATRYDVVRDAARAMVAGLGPLINVGAAVFPHGDVASQPCHPGAEVFPVTAGDPPSGQVLGPTTSAFAKAIDLEPLGGTPISSTLEALQLQLASLPGRTIMMLLTDGAPNCNPDALCGIDECPPNIEGFCPPTENCCAPGHPTGGPEVCIDRSATVDAVAAIAALGIDVYVIGIPGSEIYSDVLDEIAVAGGTALSGSPKYHRVDDIDAVETVFRQIAAANISCRIELNDPPDMTGFTNVYFDCETVPFDPIDGWDWYEGDSVFLHGDACLLLKNGEVTEVKVATGCPTELPK